MVGRFKKIGLSLSVIVLFALYAGQKQAHTDTGAGSIAALAPSVVTTSEPASVRATVVPTHISETTSRENSVTSTRPTRTAAQAALTPTSAPSGAYRDGNYTGTQADAQWGTVEVVAVITDGRLSDVQFSSYPNHRNRSKEINAQAMPILAQEAIQSQQADVDIVSGATDTSEAFITSLSSALEQAAQ